MYSASTAVEYNGSIPADATSGLIERAISHVYICRREINLAGSPGESKITDLMQLQVFAE
jgi:hypothetical protein